jgi:hypothetical protein
MADFQQISYVREILARNDLEIGHTQSSTLSSRVSDGFPQGRTPLFKCGETTEAVQLDGLNLSFVAAEPLI